MRVAVTLKDGSVRQETTVRPRGTADRRYSRLAPVDRGNSSTRSTGVLRMPNAYVKWPGTAMTTARNAKDESFV
jgi:hypothetical protein